MKKSRIIISIIILSLLVSYIFINEYRARILSRKLSLYEESIKSLNDITNTSRESFNDLYSTLSRVIAEESKKNKDLQDKVINLDKLAKSDPQLLKKYSKVYFLNENYSPVSVEKIPSDYILNTNVEYKLHTNVLPFLTSMIDDARKEGVEPLVVSAYRSFGTQATLKTQNKMTYGANTANRFVAEQGYSEHQLGTTVDLATKSMPNLNYKFDTTKEFEWLKNNAYKYGFVLSYPKGNAYYAYEPWHWRFVGVPLATQLHQDGIYFYNLDQKFIDQYLLTMFDK